MAKLFMLLIGAVPPGRHIEQHDIFFGIGEDIAGIIPELLAFWPETGGKMHIDAWREVTQVDGFAVTVQSVTEPQNDSAARLYFINLGGYKQHEFEEFHYKILIAANTRAEAINKSKATAFFRHTGFTGATSHIDDKYGIDVDDVFDVAEILAPAAKEAYRVSLAAAPGMPEDEVHLGYFKLDSFKLK